MARRKQRSSRPTGRSGRGRQAAAAGRHPSARAGAAHLAKPREMADPRIAQVLKLYEEAMRHFNKQSFRRAKEILKKVVVGPSRELAERARVHLVICEQRMQRPSPVHLRSADDHYHFAVSRINLADFDEAQEHLEKARKLAPKADYIHYALASLAALRGEADEAIEHLAHAIKLRPENRYHARNDEDFKVLEGDHRFQGLIRSERPAEARA